MAAIFSLQVVSMDGLEYEGEVQKILLRTTSGDVEILARHINYCAPIGMGTAVVTMPDGSVRRAACIGGMLSMMNNVCRVLPTTWEWDTDIDVARAEAAKKRAEERLKNPGISEEARNNAQAKLYRALVRLGTAKKK